MINKTILHFTLFSLGILFTAQFGHSQEVNWSHFRGSNLNGISIKDSIPKIWDETHTKWKTNIHDKGYSSPVVWKSQVWVTTARSEGNELYAVCVDFQTGKIVHDIKVFSPTDIIGKHSVNTYASPTSCIEEGYVYVHYGSMGTACINTSDGMIVWKRDDLKCNHVQGPGSSPIIYKNLLILHYEGVDVRYIVGLDKTNGKTVWTTNRPDEPYTPLADIGKKAYITPIIVNVKGKDMLISNGSAVCCAYNPLTGKEIWRVVRGAKSTVPMPITENGIVYYYTGTMADTTGVIFDELIAVNPDGAGDITASNVIWKKRDETSHTMMLTPIIKDGLIYTVSSKNILMCIDASNGEEIWSERLKATYNASPVYENGNIWFFSVKGDVLAIKAGRKYELVAQSKMDSGIWATPAVLRNSIILRTEMDLYKFAN